MADDRVFTLIGRFDDQITPVLEGINKSIAGLKTTMSTMTSKRGGGFNDVTQAVGRLVSSQKHLKEAIEGVGAAAKEATGELKEYKNVVGKVASAHYHIQRSGTKAGKAQTQFWTAANDSLVTYRRNMQALQRGTRIRNPRAPYGGASLTPPSPVSPKATRRSAGGGGGGGGYRGQSGLSASFAFGQQLGFGLSQPLTTAIFSGFQMGVGLLQSTLNLFTGALTERIKDEMSDLSAAGGYYSIAKRQKDPFVKTLGQAVDFTQETNAVLAKLASDLPGETQQYVEVSKRVGDSIARLVSQNEKGAIDYAKKLRAEGGLEGVYGAVEGPQARQKAMQVLIGEITKKTVMAGFGGSAGVGGQRGPHGLPALMERMLTDENISEAQLSRYAAIFGDPKISSAIGRYMPKLKEAGSDMLKRFQIINEMYDEIVPPEMIAAMRNSMAGMMEAFKDSFFNPEIGLFGIGRKLKAFAPKLNLYGQYVNEAGEVVESASLAMKADISIYEMFRDIIANFGAVMKPIVDNLTLLWDPMSQIGAALLRAREVSVNFLKVFREYDAGIKKYAAEAQGLTDAQRDALLSTRSLRATLATFSKLFKELGIIDTKEFQKIGKQLLDPDIGITGLGKILSSMVETFFNSDAAKGVGEFIGELLKTVLVQVAQLTGFFSKRLGVGKLAEGFSSAFGQEGTDALVQIFKDIYQMLINAVMFILPKIPWQAYALAAAALLIPAAISGLAVMLAEGIVGMLTGMGDAALTRMSKSGDFFERARQLYKIDKAKGAVDAGRAVTRSGTIASHSGVLAAKRIENPAFPGVALGMAPEMSLGSPRTAPRIPKPDRGPKGIRAVLELLGGEDNYPGAPKMKNFGKHLREAGGQLAKGFSKAATKTKNFFGNWMGEKGMGTRLGAGGMAGLKNPIGMLGKFGSVLTVVTGALNGFARFLQTGDIWKGIGAAIGPVAGTIIGFAIAGPLGAFIGQWILSNEQVTDKLGEIVQQLWDSVQSIMESFAGMGGDFLLFVQSLTGATTEMQALQQVLAAINVILFPLTATMDALAVAAALVRIAMLEVYMFVDKYFKGGKKQRELAEKYDEANRSLNRLIAANDEKYARISRRKGDESVLNDRKVIWNGTQWIDPTTNKPPVAKAKPADVSPDIINRNYTVGGITYDWKTGKPVSGGTSTPSPSAPAGSPAAVPQEVKQTAQNTSDLNTKAATQVTQVTKTQTNTATANVTLGNIKAGVMVISNKLTAIQNAMLSDLNNIQAGVASISSLLQSGALKVKFSMADGAYGMSGGGGYGGGGVALAGMLGNWMKGTGGAPGSIWEHPWHGGIKAKHADGSLHYAGRAIDIGAYAHEQGPILARIAQFNKMMGITPTQLFHAGNDPKGHGDHVHVAYATGYPTFGFETQREAIAWEKKATMGNVSVSSITARDGEFGGRGGDITVNAPITINGAGQNAEDIAYAVAVVLGDEIEKARSGSIFT